MLCTAFQTADGSPCYSNSARSWESSHPMPVECHILGEWLKEEGRGEWDREKATGEVGVLHVLVSVYQRMRAIYDNHVWNDGCCHRSSLLLHNNCTCNTPLSKGIAFQNHLPVMPAHVFGMSR